MAETRLGYVFCAGEPPSVPGRSYIADVFTLEFMPQRFYVESEPVAAFASQVVVPARGPRNRRVHVRPVRRKRR